MAPFKYEKKDNGKYRIYDVPIFRTHTNRGFECDQTWMQEAIRTHNEFKSKFGYLPSVIVGHNKPGRPEPESVGFFDELRLKGDVLYADLDNVRKEYAEKLLDGAYPNRSVEVLPKSKRIVALALLGGSSPFFMLPQMTYEGDEPGVWTEVYAASTMEEMDMAMNEQDKRELYGAVGSIIDDKLERFSDNLARELPEVFQLLYEAQPQGAPGMQPAVAGLQTGGTMQGTGTDGLRSTVGQVPPVNDMLMPAAHEPTDISNVSEQLAPEEEQMLAEQMAAAAESQLTGPTGANSGLVDENAALMEDPRVVQLYERVQLAETAVAGLLNKNRRLSYEQRLDGLRQSGRLFNTEEALKFAMSLQSPEQVESYFHQLETIQPQVPMTRDDATAYSLEEIQGVAHETRSLYEANRSYFKGLGIAEDDVFFGSLVGGSDNQ
jgi:hypothetical protein